MTVQQAIDQFQSEVLDIHYFRTRTPEAVQIASQIKDIGAKITGSHSSSMSGLTKSAGKTPKKSRPAKTPAVAV